MFDELFGFVFWDALDGSPGYAIVIGAMNCRTLMIQDYLQISGEVRWDVLSCRQSKSTFLGHGQSLL